MGKTIFNGLVEGSFSPLFQSYWEKSCAEVGKTPEIRYIDELKGQEYEDFDGLLMRDEKDKSLLIFLNRDLSPEEAGLTALHEITHEVLFLRGFWEVRCRLNFDMITPVVTCYSSVLTDPLIDGILRKEGFAADLLLERDIRKMTMWLADPCWETPEKDDPVFEMEMLRLLRLALSDNSELWRRLENIYRGQAGEVLDAAMDNLAIIRGHGFDSPDKQFTCLRRLLEASTIRHMVSLHSFDSAAN